MNIVTYVSGIKNTQEIKLFPAGTALKVPLGKAIKATTALFIRHH